MPPWYDRAFGPWYGKLYPHRDRDEAERGLASLLPFLPASGAVLDVGCGSGRYSRALVGRGFAVAGVDRSRALLFEAMIDPVLAGRLVRGDMRSLPFRSRAFAAVLSMFTSFGYFESAGAHRSLLIEYARVARPGGVLVLDYVNAARVRAALEPETEQRVDGHRVTERRRIESMGGEERMVKDIEVTDDEGAVVEQYYESVALYDRSRILEMLGAAGWCESVTLGDYDGGAWHAEAPRQIVVAKREGGR